MADKKSPLPREEAGFFYARKKALNLQIHELGENLLHDF